MKRAFHFSYDERVYQDDLQPILEAARAFPNARMYTFVPGWTEEDQVFVLAHSPEEAKEIYISEYKLTPKAASDIKVEDFEFYED